MSDAGDAGTLRFECHIDGVDEALSAIDNIAARCELSRGRIKSAMAAGAAWLENSHGTRRLRRGNRLLQPGEHLHFYYDSKVLAERPSPATLVADEGDYSVWDKPYGMYSHGSKWGDHCTLYRWAEQHLQPARDAMLVHRLDRATRGLMLLAHNKRTASDFGRMFRERQIEKHYRALIEGEWAPSLPHRIESVIDGKAASSIVHGCRYDERDDATAVEIQILSGRKHQARIHLAATGHPVIGDRLHGSSRLQRDLQLTASRLVFDCPRSGERRAYQL